MKLRELKTVDTVRDAYRRRAFAGVPDLCADCQQGRHGEHHVRGLGCTAIVAARPRDFVCRCTAGAS